MKTNTNLWQELNETIDTILDLVSGSIHQPELVKLNLTQLSQCDGGTELLGFPSRRLRYVVNLVNHPKICDIYHKYL